MQNIVECCIPTAMVGPKNDTLSLPLDSQRKELEKE